MNNKELDELLKSAPVPESAADFWDELPKRVTAKIHWSQQRVAAHETPPARLRIAWAACALLAGVILVLPLLLRRDDAPRETFGSFAQVQKCYLEIEAMFPNQVQAIMFNDAGSRIVLAEKADVPDSTPLYLKICGPRGCQQVVTFSGQQIRVNGEEWDVLTDAAGNVLLVGKQFVWSSESPVREFGKYRVETRSLETAS
jgi:hypothetical protein